MVNSSLSEGIISLPLKEASGHPFTRSPSLDPTVLDNFHTISPLPFLGKVVERRWLCHSFRGHCKQHIISNLFNQVSDSGMGWKWHLSWFLMTSGVGRIGVVLLSLPYLTTWFFWYYWPWYLSGSARRIGDGQYSVVLIHFLPSGWLHLVMIGEESSCPQLLLCGVLLGSVPCSYPF